MSELKAHFQQLRDFLGPNVYYDFILAHGREYSTGPNTYAGRRGERGMCFMNATHLALTDLSKTYCEGKVFVHGVALDHAWCIDANGVVVDPTITNEGQVNGYFGVPFKTTYVLRANKLNKVYCVLDYFYAGKTAPKLFELGLEAGQQWLMDQPIPKRGYRRKKAA